MARAVAWSRLERRARGCPQSARVRDIDLPRAVAPLYLSLKALGQLSQNLMLGGLLLAAGQATAPGMGLSAVLVAAFLPSVFLGPLGGVAADRLGPQRASAAGWLIKIGALAVAGFSPLWLVAVLFSCGHQLTSPAEMALIRVLPASMRQRMHGQVVAAQYVGQGAGALTAITLFMLIGGQTVLLLALAVAVLSLGATLGLRHLLRTRTKGSEPSRLASRGLGGAARLLLVDGDGRLAVCALLLKSVAGRAVLVALPVYASQNLGSHQFVVVLIAGLAVAGVLIGLKHAAGFDSMASLRRALFVACAGMAACMIALAVLDYGVTVVAQGSRVGPVMRMEAAVNTTVVVVAPLAVVLGYVLTTALVAGRGILTRLGEQGQQARLFALQESVTEAMALGPILLVGAGVDFAGPRLTLAGAGALAALAIVALAVGNASRPGRYAMAAAER